MKSQMKPSSKLFYAKTAGLFIITAALLLLAGCGIAEITEPAHEYTPTPTPAHEAAAPSPEEADITHRDPVIISPQQAQDMMSQEGIIILDVRTQDEFDSGHIEHAILLPYNQIAALAASVIPDKTQTVLVYCRAGRRSNIAAWALADLGYTAVYDFGGIQDWHGPIVGPRQVFFNYFGELPEESITPFTFTTTQCISPDMDKLTFTLEGYSTRSYMRNFERTQFWPFANSSIHTITIHTADGTVLQEITGLVTKHHVASEANMYGLEFDDFNFDGYMDMMLWQFPGGSMRDMPSYFWLWDSEAGLFVPNECLMDISMGASITTIPEYRQIQAFSRGGPGLYGRSIYEYHDGLFVLVRDVLYEFFYSDDDDSTEVTRRVTETNHITGEVTVTYQVETE